MAEKAPQTKDLAEETDPSAIPQVTVTSAAPVQAASENASHS